jgi:1-acyl-sn-glycerol-3-phosphate acyltransferase
MEKPQEKDSRYFRLLAKLLVPPVLGILGARIHAKGFDQGIPKGRFLLVCNHLHEMDPIVLLKYFPKSQLAFISKQETKKLFLVGPIMHKILCQFINRENDKEALKTILNCIRLIKEDEVSIAAFPEGYIRPNRKLHRFRGGMFKVATKTNVPIVVCTITNTNNLIRNFKKLKPTHIDLHLVKIIRPEEYEGLTTVDLAENIYQMMAEDLGPDRVSPEGE